MAGAVPRSEDGKGRELCKSPGPDHKKPEGQARQLGSPPCVGTMCQVLKTVCCQKAPPEEKTTNQKPLTQVQGGDSTTLSGSHLSPAMHPSGLLRPVAPGTGQGKCTYLRRNPATLLPCGYQWSHAPPKTKLVSEPIII